MSCARRSRSAHERRYGYRDDDGEVELVTIRASVWGAAPELSLRGAGSDGERIEGPAVRPLPEATLYVPPGWSGEWTSGAPCICGAMSNTILDTDRREWGETPTLAQTTTATPTPGGTHERAGPDRAPGGHRSTARGVRGDGRRADPLGAVVEHQGAPRRLDRPVRPARRDGDAGRAHTRAPRLDAGGGGGDPRRGPLAGWARGC